MTKLDETQVQLQVGPRVQLPVGPYLLPVPVPAPQVPVGLQPLQAPVPHGGIAPPRSPSTSTSGRQEELGNSPQVTPLPRCENPSRPEAPTPTPHHTEETPAPGSGVGLGGDADQAWHYGTIQTQIILPLVILIDYLPDIGDELNRCNAFMDYGRSNTSARLPARDVLTALYTRLQGKGGSSLPFKRRLVKKLKVIAQKYANVLQRMEKEGANANKSIDVRTISQTFASLATLLLAAEIYGPSSDSSVKGADVIAPLPKTAPVAPRWMIPDASVEYSIEDNNVFCAARILAVHTDDFEGVTYCTISINGVERQTTGNRLRPRNSSTATMAESWSELPSATTKCCEAPNADGYALIARYDKAMPLPEGKAYTVSSDTRDKPLFSWQGILLTDLPIVNAAASKIRRILKVSKRALYLQNLPVQEAPDVQLVPSTNTRNVNWHIVHVTRTVTTNALRTPTSKFVIRPRDLVISVD